jgi:hypothetical protein
MSSPSAGVYTMFATPTMITPSSLSDPDQSPAEQTYYIDGVTLVLDSFERNLYLLSSLRA